jgi:general secretion pathway protein D
MELFNYLTLNFTAIYIKRVNGPAMRYDFKYTNLLKRIILVGVVCLNWAMSAVYSQEQTADLAVNTKSELEAIKRVERSLLYNKQLEEGAKFLAVGELKSARDRYKSVADATEKEPSYLETHLAARKGEAKALVAQALLEEKAKNNAAALDLLEQAVTLDPTNTAYKQSMSRVKEQISSMRSEYPDNQAVTPGFRDKVENIQKLMFEGDSFMETGQYQRAIGRYKEVLTIDEYNDAARKRIEKVEKIKYKTASLRREARREKALVDVESQWPTVPIDRKEYAVSTVGQSVKQTGTLKMLEKLEKIVIPELNFSEVDIADAVKFLEDQSRALDPDPEKTGINFALKSMPTVSTSGAPDAAPAAVSAATRTLTLNLKNVPLIEVLNYIKSLTNLQYQVDEFAVYLFPNNETSEVLVIRNFSVPPTFFPQSVKETSKSTGDFTNRTVEIATVPVKEELEKKGVKFPAGASAAYLPRTAKMVVKNTLGQLSLIDQLLSREVNQTKQVEVEAKFIDFADDKLKELTSNFAISGRADLNPSSALNPNNVFGPVPNNSQITGTGPVATGPDPFTNLFPNSPASGDMSARTALRTSNSMTQNQLDSLLGLGSNRQANQLGVSGIIGGSGAKLLITALESALGSDLMSAPKITIVSGQKSKIRVSREMLYPTEYDPPEIIQSSSTTGTAPPPIAVPSNPTNFQSRDIGVTLEVKATATADRRIDLELKPQVTEFQGFINYASDVVQSVGASRSADGAVNNPGFTSTIAEGVALTPVFAVRKVDTKIQVIDGQTVVMGGFIREDKQTIEDKVPILGDIPFMGKLFRSKVDRSVKRNLIMLITARLMKADGTPEFLTEGEREAYEISLVPTAQAK